MAMQSLPQEVLMDCDIMRTWMDNLDIQIDKANDLQVQISSNPLRLNTMYERLCDLYNKIFHLEDILLEFLKDQIKAISPGEGLLDTSEDLSEAFDESFFVQKLPRPSDLLEINQEVAVQVDSLLILCIVAQGPNGKYPYSISESEYRLLNTQTEFHKGDDVLAIFPDTTTFYHAVIQQDTSRPDSPAAQGDPLSSFPPLGDEIVPVQFENDPDSTGKNITREVSLKYVLSAL